MKRRIHIISILACLTLGGCIDITEELFLEADGSGRYVTQVDASRLASMMQMARTFLPDSLQQQLGPDGNAWKDSLLHIWPQLDTATGLSEVSRSIGKDDIVTISFRFRQLAALNKALQGRYAENNRQGLPQAYQLEKGRLLFQGPAIPDLGEALKSMSGGGSDMPTGSLPDTDMLRTLTGGMKIIFIQHLPGIIIDHSNPKATLLSDRRSIRIEADLMDKEASASLHNDIKFK